MFILIDNYDSFTYNLVHFLGELGAAVDVVRNDQITPLDVLDRRPEGVILSPGPCTPDEAGICLDMVGAAARARLPLLRDERLDLVQRELIVGADEPRDPMVPPMVDDDRAGRGSGADVVRVRVTAGRREQEPARRDRPEP